jgi:hypothetical protein
MLGLHRHTGNSAPKACKRRIHVKKSPNKTVPHAPRALQEHELQAIRGGDEVMKTRHDTVMKTRHDTV